MGWYAASVIMYTKFKDGNQDIYPVWENVILIEAPTAAVAMAKAEKRGREDEGDSSGTYHYEDRPAIMSFAGIRKLIECDDLDNRPGDGTELTYSRMQVDSADDFQKLIKGEPVLIKYEE